MRILVFGNSIVFGFCDHETGWVNRLRMFTDLRALKDSKYDRAVYNLGVSGNTTKELVIRFENEIKARLKEEQEIVIIISIGINDSYVLNKNQEERVSQNEFSANLQNLINIAKKYSSKIFFVGLNPIEEQKVNPVPWRPEISYIEARIRLYDSIVNEVCKKNNIDFIDIMKEFLKRDYKKLLEDGVHPNTEGHKIIYEVVKEFLSKKNII